VRLLVALAGVGGRVRVARRDDVVGILVLALELGRARRVVVGGLGLRLVVLIGVLVEGGLVVAAGVRGGPGLRSWNGVRAYRGSRSSSPPP
jgi:hypothetical protein